MREVSHEQLCEKIDGGDDFVLVDARSPMGFALSHLPGAVNLPPIWVDERAHRRIPDRAKEVLLALSDPTAEPIAKAPGKGAVGAWAGN